MKYDEIIVIILSRLRQAYIGYKEVPQIRHNFHIKYRKFHALVSLTV
jgi:hypothetical protein